MEKYNVWKIFALIAAVSCIGCTNPKPVTSTGADANISGTGSADSGAGIGTGGTETESAGTGSAKSGAGTGTGGTVQ
jgi:hypothetical protein